jgi:TonB family protein
MKTWIAILLIGGLSACASTRTRQTEQISETMTAHRPDFKACYDKVLAKSRVNPPAGRMELRFAILADGTVKDASIFTTTLGSADLENCVLKATEAIRFPPRVDGTKVAVTYPFKFGPAKP